jgi:hypothetical protein
MTGIFSAASNAATFRIEIDYMVGTHSHQPSQLVINAVVQMFACQGHTLIIDVDDAIPHHNVLIRDPDDCDSFFGYSGAANSFGALKAQFFDHTHANGWHYCIFAHNYQDDNCNLCGLSRLLSASGHRLFTAFDGIARRWLHRVRKRQNFDQHATKHRGNVVDVNGVGVPFEGGAHLIVDERHQRRLLDGHDVLRVQGVHRVGLAQLLIGGKPGLGRGDAIGLHRPEPQARSIVEGQKHRHAEQLTESRGVLVERLREPAGHEAGQLGLTALKARETVSERASSPRLAARAQGRHVGHATLGQPGKWRHRANGRTTNPHRKDPKSGSVILEQNFSPPR